MMVVMLAEYGDGGDASNILRLPSADRISGSYFIIVKSSSRSQISVPEYGLLFCSDDSPSFLLAQLCSQRSDAS